MKSSSKDIISTNNAPAAIGAYSQAVAVHMPINSLIFTSGQLGINPSNQILLNGIEAQAVQAMKNIKSILEMSNSNLNKVIKATLFIANMDDFSTINKIYESFFEEGNYPARSVVQVARLPKNALIEIEVIAHL